MWYIYSKLQTLHTKDTTVKVFLTFTKPLSVCLSVCLSLSLSLSLSLTGQRISPVLQADEVPEGLDDGDTTSLDSLSSITSAGSASTGDAYMTAQITQTGTSKKEKEENPFRTSPLHSFPAASLFCRHKVFKISSLHTKSSGQRCCSYQAPATWNQLPVSVWHDTSVNSFRSSLKTFFFSKTFSSVPILWYMRVCFVCIETLLKYVHLKNL